MRILVFFDLPVQTTAERRAYGQFRKYLVKNGFIMLQESVYCKLAPNQTAVEPYGEELARLVMEVNALASKICMRMEYNVTWNELDRFDDLLKLMAIHPDEEYMPLPERILEYCQLARDLLGKKLVVCYGLHACLSEEEFELLCKEAVYRKFCLLLIEAAQPPRALDEKMIVIDRDLCML